MRKPQSWLTALGTGAYFQVRVAMVIYTLVFLVGILTFRFTPWWDTAYTLMGWVSLLEILVIGRIFVRDRREIATDIELAELWITGHIGLMFFAFACRSWGGVAVAAVMFFHSITLRRYAKRARDHAILDELHHHDKTNLDELHRHNRTAFDRRQLMTGMVHTRIDVDYDPRRWVLVPRPEVGIGIGVWAQRTAKSWANDLGHGRRWRNEFERRLGLMGRFPSVAKFDVTLIHVIDVPDAPPSLAPASIDLSEASTNPDGLFGALLHAAAPTMVEQPRVEALTRDDGTPLHYAVVYRRGVDQEARPDPDSVQVNIWLVWQPQPYADFWMSVSSPELGRALAMREDLIALASATQLIEIAPDA